MFKPGDRLVCVYSRDYPERIGLLATCIDRAQMVLQDREPGNLPLCVRYDMPLPHFLGGVYTDWSSRPEHWRRIDGPSGESAESFLQSLSKPKVNA